MPMIHVSDRGKQMIERFVAEGRAADEAACVETAVQLYAEEPEEYVDDTAYVIAQARRGIADIEAGRFTTIACKADEDAFWERVRVCSAVMGA